MRTTIEMIGAFGAGTAVLAGPTAFAFGRNVFAVGLLYVVRLAVERVSLNSLLLLAILGIAAGVLCRAATPLLALAAIAVFPLWSLIDIAYNGLEGHALLPFEWAFYAFYGVLVLIGAVAGRLARNFVLRRRTV